MADVDGTYETIVKSPLGDQKSTLTVKSDGSTFTGTNSGAMGSVDITDGTVDGNAGHTSRTRRRNGLKSSAMALLAASTCANTGK